MGIFSDVVLALPSLRGYWRHGEASGATTLVDSSGNALGGTYVSGAAVTLGVAGAIRGEADTAVAFADAGGTYAPATIADPGTASLLDVADGPWSIGFACKRSSTLGSLQTVLNKGTGAYEVRFNTSDQVAVHKSGTGGAGVTSTTTLGNDGRWHLVVITKAAGSFPILYIDGVAGTTQVTNHTYIDTNNVLRIAHLTTTTQRYVGSLDELFLTASVLSSGDVTSLNNALIAVRAAAALTGSGSLAAAGSRVRTSSAALSGEGTMTSTGRLRAAGAASLAGSSTMTPAGSRTRTAAAQLAGAGSMNADGHLRAAGAAALSGSGDFAAAGRLVAGGRANLSGDGALAAVAVRVRSGGANLSGSGSLSALGVRVARGAAAFAGEGAMTAVGSRVRLGQAVFAGAGTLAALARRVARGAAVFAGVGTMTAKPIGEVGPAGRFDPASAPGYMGPADAGGFDPTEPGTMVGARPGTFDDDSPGHFT